MQPNHFKRGMRVVQFYSKSKERNDLPGVGDDWRKTLSNFYPSKITIDGATYPTCEHAFHAAKCRSSDNYSAYKEFTVNGKVGMRPEEAKKAGGRKGFEALGAKLDKVKWERIKSKENMKILQARWGQHPEFQAILRALYPRIRDDNWYLLHFERSGKKSEWGGSYSETEGVKGQNLLGRQLMALVRNKLDNTACQQAERPDKKRKSEKEAESCQLLDKQPSIKRIKQSVISNQ